MSENKGNKPRKKSNAMKSIRLGIFIVIGILIYAFAFQVVKVDLENFRQESREESRVRVTRALAKPDIFEFDQSEQLTYIPVWVPCSSSAESAPEPDTSDSYMILTPNCNDPGTEIQVEGFNFPANSEGPISFIPSSNPDHEIALQLARVEVDGQGYFSTMVELPDRPSEENQLIRATMRANVGMPRFTETARDTGEKILETVFLALLATTIGTILAVPVSFIAAKNIMSDVKGPLASVALAIIGWPLGFAIGLQVADLIHWIAEFLKDPLLINVVSVAVIPALGGLLLRVAVPREELIQPSLLVRILRFAILLVLGLGTFLFITLLGSLMITLGDWMIQNLPPLLSFLGNFVYQLGDVTVTVMPLFLLLGTGFILSSMLGRVGQTLSETHSTTTMRVISLLLSALAGAAILAILGAVIDWLYEIDNLMLTFVVPAAIGAILGAILALRAHPKQALPIGYVIYTVSRTILNAIRSVEPLIMAIVAVIWVGIGPFAGVLALALHTIAALGKLYSEQVESISPGPLEAINATGANRLQMIIYAVVPQIIPPYISFTMYRWDINVRMSTIIGFAGGGGIGFLLQQNINLLNYRAAAAQMLAIAIVVASMDYLSSYLRERYV
jgi:phosphonate ABC transporter permease subunit PhnE